MTTISDRPIAVCPHCSKEYRAQGEFEPRLKLCDVEDGGCDRHFVYRCIEQPRKYAISSSPLNFQPQE